MAAISSTPILLFSILVSIFFNSSAQTCSTHRFRSNKVYTFCKDLPYLHAHLHWNYLKSTGQVQIAYRAGQNPKGWIAWAINPSRRGMVGSQALVAFRDSIGRMRVYTTSVNSYNPSMKPGNISFLVSNLSAEYANNEMTIFAVVGPIVGGTRVNHVWQSGDLVSNGFPQMHPMSFQNIQSTGVIDFQSF